MLYVNSSWCAIWLYFWYPGHLPWIASDFSRNCDKHSAQEKSHFYWEYPTPKCTTCLFTFCSRALSNAAGAFKLWLSSWKSSVQKFSVVGSAGDSGETESQSCCPRKWCFLPDYDQNATDVQRPRLWGPLVGAQLVPSSIMTVTAWCLGSSRNWHFPNSPLT